MRAAVTFVTPEREKLAPTGRPSLKCLDSLEFSSDRPQERHADLGLVDDDDTPDMRDAPDL